MQQTGDNVSSFHPVRSSMLWQVLPRYTHSRHSTNICRYPKPYRRVFIALERVTLTTYSYGELIKKNFPYMIVTGLRSGFNAKWWSTVSYIMHKHKFLLIAYVCILWNHLYKWLQIFNSRIYLWIPLVYSDTTFAMTLWGMRIIR